MDIRKFSVLTISIILFIIALVVSKLIFFLEFLNPVLLNDTTKFQSINKHRIIKDDFNNITWMLQITDLHLSTFHDESRIEDFRNFCNNTLHVISPSVVLATGDLTDAKMSDAIGSRQYEIEWIYYRDALLKNNVTSRTIWLDVRGNHDNFNVFNINSDKNYYRQYSVQGKKYAKSYIYEYRTKYNEVISFIAVDACLSVGTKRPFNFIGEIDDDEMDTIRKFSQQAVNNSDYILWFGHYPTSTILSPASSQLRSLIGSTKKSLAYLCGHLHTLGGLARDLYIPQKEGYFELELGDWMTGRIFRIIAVDHGQMSFSEVRYDKWPVVLVTNPKPLLLNPPIKDYKPIIPYSTHIRVLVFSPHAITKVKIMVDDGRWENCNNVEGPLYVLPWNPDTYHGVHVIRVLAEDSSGKKTEILHEFSLDGSIKPYRFFSRFVLITNWNSFFQISFISAVMLVVVPLTVCRYEERKNSGPVSCKTVNRFHERWLRRLYILSNINCLFYPLVVYPVYLIFGPWFIGELLEDHPAVIFSWGMFVDWTYVPASYTFIFGFVQVYILHLPLTYIFARQVDRRIYWINRHKCKHVKFPKDMKNQILWIVWDNICLIGIVTLQIWDSYNLYRSYGKYTLYFCPIKTWWIIMVIYLRYRIANLKKEYLMEVSRRWAETYRFSD